MNLDLISFVGIDTNTKLEDISNFSSDITCEWSVLFSDSKSLTNHIRYPSYNFCKEFLEWGQKKGLNTSLHLCGDVIQRYFNQDKDVMELSDLACRIQLNLNIKSFPDYDKLSDDVISMITNRGHTLILQQNKTKEKFMSKLLAKTDLVHVLHDGSGGFGREITEVVPPEGNCFTGYAGGIKPENVVRIVNLIENNNPNKKDYYIDMESGIRTDNIFSVEKCRQVVKNLTVVE